METFFDADIITEHYLELVEDVTSPRKTLIHYPALVYPESLLCCPKLIIRKAVAKTRDRARQQHRKLRADLLDWSLAHLEAFIDDEEAHSLNQAFLGQPDYWQRIKQAELLDNQE